MKTAFKLLLIAIAILFYPSGAFMSQIVDKDITLDQLIKRSHLIVVARMVDYEAPKEGPSIKPQKFQLKEVLYKKSPVLNPEEQILVYPAHYHVMKAMSEQYAKKGNQGMPSPILDSYNSSIKSKGYSPKEDVIIFLLEGDDESTFEFSVSHAFESLDHKDKILKAVKKK